ncbi:uncharacterized protein [Diadema antillarum]|uniref:uncharacterized protein n=1 Tax=Diadema antillarum TaxID=105358 RepID=UPI003A868CAA
MSDNAEMTMEEALWFISDVLDVTSPESRLKADRPTFLQDLIDAWKQHIPFQSVSAIAVPQQQRHLPSFEEIKKDVFAKIGGLCYVHNVFFYVFMQTLGYNVTLVTCDISFADSHVIIMAHNLTSEGSMHMVDVGSGYPTFTAVPCDFERESPEYHDSFLRYRFVRDGDLIIRQHHADTDPRAALWPDRVKDGWYSFIYIHYKEPKKISYFDAVMTRIYTTVLPSPPYLSSPRCMTWPNRRLVCIKDATLLQEIEKGHVQKSYFRSPDEILTAFAKHFPDFPADMVKATWADEHVKCDFNKE